MRRWGPVTLVASALALPVAGAGCGGDTILASNDGHDDAPRDAAVPDAEIDGSDAGSEGEDASGERPGPDGVADGADVAPPPDGPRCGNGTVDEGEECDDGNRLD